MKNAPCAFEFSNDLREICKPLFQKTEISFFEYIRLLNEDSSVEWLSTNPIRTGLWTNKKMSASTMPMLSDVRDKKLRYYFWDSVLYSMDDMTKRKNIENFLALSNNEFSISHGFVIFEDLGKYSNVYSFGTSPGNECMREFYINNLDILQNFIFHLKEKTVKVFKYTATSDASVEYKSKFRNRDCDFNVKRFYLDAGVSKTSEKNYVTAQELKVLLLISKGFTIKEISSLLDLSTRTVEYYLKSAKERLNLKTNHQLIALFWESSLAGIALAD